MKRRRGRRGAAAAAAARGAPAAPHDESAGLAPARRKERADVLARAEAALAARRPAEALPLFEQAGLMLHAADAELGIVRAHMQAGDYRHALAYAAHTAGAHQDETAGTALYAWLLRIGGQTEIAGRVLAEARARAPSDAILRATALQMERPWPVASAPLLNPPARFAPYASALPPAAVAVASGTLLAGGRMALLPTACLQPGARYWVRNGLGDTAEARLVRRDALPGLALCTLAQPLPDPQLLAAERDAFPGSVAFALEFAPQRDAQAAWPHLHAGFVGAALPVASERRLGIALPKGSLHGGPVLDQRGALVGIAVGGREGDKLVGVQGLQEGEAALPRAQQAARPGMDAVYEQGLRHALQVLRRA